jgi:hypothetical protein
MWLSFAQLIEQSIKFGSVPPTTRSFLRETEDRWLTRNVESQNRSCDLIWRPKADTYSTVSKRLAKTE